MSAEVLETRCSPASLEVGKALLDAARLYTRMGLSVFSVCGKIPPKGFSLAQAKKRPATDAELQRGFARPGVTGVAMMCGQVSGGLYVRDFDKRESFHSWCVGHPELAAELPTVQTSRGNHVYVVMESATATQSFDDGEFRGERNYVVMPPSRHPSGAVYKWINPLRSLSSMRSMKRDEADLQKSANRIPSASLPLPTAPYRSLTILTVDDALERALYQTTPGNHKRLWHLARAVMALERAAGRAYAQKELMSVFCRWYERAKKLKFLRARQSKVDYWNEFCDARDNAKTPLGEDALATAWGRAQIAPPPPEAALFEHEDITLLMALCRELQKDAGAKEPFFLAVESVKSLFNHSHAMNASRWLKALVRAGILEIVEKGSRQTNRATRYRYLPPIHQEEGVAEIEELP